MSKQERGRIMRADKKIRNILRPFRNCLDELMLPAIHKRVLLYGYESYTGRFLKWYAEYYHGIKIDYLVSPNMKYSSGYEQEIFCPTVLDYDWRDVRDAVIWLAEPVTERLRDWLKNRGGG